MLHIEQTTHTTNNGTTFIRLKPIGRLDSTTAWQFRSLAKGVYLQVKSCPNLVIDLSNVNFIDSSGLTALVASLRDADRLKGHFCLCQILEEVKLVFEATMMDCVLPICEDCADCEDNYPGDSEPISGVRVPKKPHQGDEGTAAAEELPG